MPYFVIFVSESIWETPTEGFVSLADQKKIKEKKKNGKEKKEKLKEVKEGKKEESIIEENVSASKKEKHKSKKAKKSDIKIFNKKDLQKMEGKSEEVFGPVHHIQSFGSWTEW